MSRRTRLLLGVACFTLATTALVELGARVAVEKGALRTPRPPDEQLQLWLGDDPRFGVWRRPNVLSTHATACFSVPYRTNSVGARDRERTPGSEAPRVAVLGDSFLAGWGVREGRRASNRLERSTGREHLNFAMAHFGPYQELLVYEELLGDFEHRAVIASVVPENDFADIDLEFSRRMLDYDYRYRPYLVGDPPDLSRLDLREPRLRRWLRHHSYAFNALLLATRAGGAPAPPATSGSENAPPVSRFYDFGEAQAARLEAILDRLALAAGGRPVAVVLVPVYKDLVRHEREDGADPLSTRLASLEKRHELRLVNLLPAMAAHDVDWGSYFLGCDYHWSERGHAVAAELIERQLRGWIY